MKTYVVVKSGDGSFAVGVVGRMSKDDLEQDLEAVQGPVVVEASDGFERFERLCLSAEQVAERFPVALAAWERDDHSARERAEQRSRLATILGAAKESVAGLGNEPPETREMAAAALADGGADALLAWEAVAARA